VSKSPGSSASSRMSATAKSKLHMLTPQGVTAPSLQYINRSTVDSKYSTLDEQSISVLSTVNNSSIDEEEDTPQRQLFSPSFVKKMSMSRSISTTLEGESLTFSPKPHGNKSISDVLSTVMRNIVPASSTTTHTTHQNSRSSFGATRALTESISQALIGSSSSNQFDKAVQMKMELLTELSHARAAVGEHEKKMIELEKTVNELSKEKILVQNEKNYAEMILNEERKKKSMVESTLIKKDQHFQTISSQQAENLRIAHSRLTDSTTEANSLAKLNELLIIQYEQLKVQFQGKENELNRQITMMQHEVAKEMNTTVLLDNQVENLKSQLGDKDNKLSTVSKELIDRTSMLEAKESALQEAKKKTDELLSSMPVKLVGLESNLQLTRKELETVKAEKVRMQNDVSHLSQSLK